MLSSSAQVTMQFQNRKRAPAWTIWEVLDLITVWGEDSVLTELHSKRLNAKTFEKISKAMMDRGHNRDSTQWYVKRKKLRQAYQKVKESNGCSRTEPQTCHFYAELQAILGGGVATTTPPLSVDTNDGVFSVTMPENFADGEEDEDVEETTQHSILPNNQDLFLTLTEIPSQPFQGSIPDHEAMEGTSAANVSSLPPPSQRLSQIRHPKKHTHDEMFSELMQVSHTERAQQKGWRNTTAQDRKMAREYEERWWQEDQRMHEATLGLLQEQTDMIQSLVEVHECHLERLPLQPLFNQPLSSPCSIAASLPRRPRTWGSRLQTPNHSTPVDRRLSFNKY
ncbi:LOW QUALITY PROTEIN: uncharacterized protein LOC142047772 [Chelonoidis abingdonii]|uniref:LOW QUALITY PROTEIN: uncharacterized protein LOC142047772 n=1 Tax=Chelonoidis abingdonii TaxID=106734 RepID=UPI003F496359